ncbi:MAG: hypothetical protein K2M94_03045 [Paramuribaculum sp.]|nr:hypothetical protein [Paramuribaculum sp.]
MVTSLRNILSTITVIISGHAALGQSFIDFLPASPEIIPDYNISTAQNYISQQPIHHIEGIWRFTDTGVTMAIERHSPDNRPIADNISGYRMVIIHSPNRSLKPGTVIGYISATAKPTEYEAKMYSRQNGIKLDNAKKYTLTLNDAESSIIFNKHRTAISINIWRALPYMFRGLIRKNEPEKISHGCIRIFPEPDKPSEPIYF